MLDSDWGKPVVDLNLAFQVCLVVAESILGSKTYPKLQDELNTVQTEYELILKETEKKFAKEIVESVLKRDKAKTAQGWFSFLSIGLVSRYHNVRAKLKFKKYKEKHL